jgi:hypothetical protein
MILQYFADVCKQIAPVFLIIEALPFTCLAEWLTWETRTKDVVWRNILWPYLCNISFYMSAGEVDGI